MHLVDPYSLHNWNGSDLSQTHEAAYLNAVSGLIKANVCLFNPSFWTNECYCGCQINKYEQTCIRIQVQSQHQMLMGAAYSFSTIMRINDNHTITEVFVSGLEMA